MDDIGPLHAGIFGGIGSGLGVGVGDQRTLDQDVGFCLRQLVDIALKALSPGINTTTTAVMCVDQLGALLRLLAGRQLSGALRAAGGELRVLRP